MSDDTMGPDEDVYGTDDPKAIREIFRRAYEAQQIRESTFGGYLRSLRQRREWLVEQAAGNAKVSALSWASWESDNELPTETELRRVMARLPWSQSKQTRLLELLKLGTLTSLRKLSHTRVEKLAASGPQSTSAELIWNALPGKAQALLQAWGAAHQRRMPEELLEVIGAFSSDQDRDAWVNQVLSHD